MLFRPQAGHRLEWAILVPVAAPHLESLVRSLPLWDDEDDDDVRTWHVVAGSGQHAALIETEPGSSGTEDDIAAELSRRTGATVYAVCFSGYDDPDHGLPSIQAYDGVDRKLIWMAPFDEDEGLELGAPELFPGPEGIPCDDPFAFAEALGCPLRELY